MHGTKTHVAVGTVVAGALVLACAVVGIAQAPDPAVGTWKLNIAKSTFSPGPAPKSMTVVIAPAGKGLNVAIESVGLQPALEISSGQLVLTVSGRDRAQVSSASLQVDPALIDVFRTGDVLHLVRTGTADLGVFPVRARQLILAVGAAAAVPMAEGISVQEGPERGSSAVKPDTRPRKDTWVDVSVSGEASRRRRSGDPKGDRGKR